MCEKLENKILFFLRKKNTYPSYLYVGVNRSTLDYQPIVIGGTFHHLPSISNQWLYIGPHEKWRIKKNMGSFSC